MNHKSSKKQKWSITQMAAHIPKEDIVSVEPLGDDSTSPSYATIKMLALKKRNDYLDGKEGKNVKKTGFNLILVAAIVSLMSITAFAAFGETAVAYVKSIFGDSTALLQDEIMTPEVSATGGGREMALEAVVTDGFITNMIVSLTGERPLEVAEHNLFSVNSPQNFRSYRWYPLDDFTTDHKTYYAVTIENEKRLDTASVTIALNKDIADIEFSFELKKVVVA